MANVFVIRISENKDIRSAYQLLKGFYNISLASMNLNEARKSLVVLVFVAIDLNSNNTFTNSDLHSHDHTIKNIVDTTVKAINDIMFKIVMERKHFLYDLVWYVQPVAYNNSEYDLTKGVYAGINWIVRTISSQC